MNIVKALICFSYFTCVVYTSFSQVGINTDTPAPGALLDINSPNKGLLMTRVALSATNNPAPITPSPTIGLMVYNTETASSGSTQVTPGFYYWSGVEWRRLFNQGYTLNYTQSREVVGVNSTNQNTFNRYLAIPGLDSGLIEVPFDGTYQVMFSGYFAAGEPINQSFDGGTQGSYTLYITNDLNVGVLLDEKYVASESKVIDGEEFFHQSEHITIIRNIYLSSSEQYRFRIFGREWQRQNAGPGYFGKDSSDYDGADGGSLSGTLPIVNNIQRGEMIITLIKQN